MSRKKIIAIILTFIVAVVSVSVISYSIAGLKNRDKAESEIEQGLIRRAASYENYKTNIDLIIENSNKTGDEAQTFNIVEVIPQGTTPSALANYISDGTNEYFKTNVMDANSTKNQIMKSGMIKLDTIGVSSATSLDDTVDSEILGGTASVNDVLNSADLIYVSSPAYGSYNNNMNEDIYNFLHTYASGKNKPIIMDYVTKTDSGSVTTVKTYKDLAKEIRNNFIRFRTFAWDNSLSADDFFSGKTGSYYLKYNLERITSNGGKVLVVTTNQDEDGSMYKKMSSADEASLIKKAYYGTGKPDHFAYTFVNPAEITSAAQLDGYDFILLENNIMSQTISDDVYAKLKTLSESSKYILYDFRGSFDDNSSVVVSSNNYIKLMNLLVNADGAAKQVNVLPVRYGFFGSLYSMGSEQEAKESAKAIADIINTSIYRDSEQTGENGRKFRVLEIEPCYPIDLELAEKRPKISRGGKYPVDGCYYTIPDQVMYGVTKDEIGEDTEYYAFEISKAKISHATGIPYGQIEVEQMSANELISSKEIIAENYDLVYIGGDNSALVPHELVNYAGLDWNWGNKNHINDCIKTFTCFDMYSHTGPLVDYQVPDGYDMISGGTNSVQTNGYDLTTIKRDELKNYIDAGLPVMIDKVVTDAFEQSYANDPKKDQWDSRSHSLQQLELTDIDPDCNMYQVLKYAYLASKDDKRTYKNIGWGIIDTSLEDYTMMVDNSNRSLGNTLGSEVTVYNNDDAHKYGTNIANLVNQSAERPYLSILTSPKEYQEGNDATTNTLSTVSFSAKVNASDTSEYTFSLYVDEDGDGVFSDSERKAGTSGVPGGTVSLSYQLDDGFFGLINWKIVATAQNGFLSDVKTGSAFYKLDPDMKKKVRILQIMPLERNQQKAGVSDGHSLYFCTECQQTSKMINYNVTVNGRNHDGNPGLNSGEDKDTIDGVYVGKHEHKFGIVKYDPNVNNDNWEDNFADTLTHGPDGSLDGADFEFDLDIMTVNEFDKLCAEAQKRTEQQIAANAADAAVNLAAYQAAQADAELLSYESDLQTELYKVAEMVSGKNSKYSELIAEKIGTLEKPGMWIVDKDYYKFWEYCNSSADPDLYNSLSLDNLKNAYANYIKKYDVVIDLKDKYKESSRAAYNADSWLLENYDIIVLGFADEFNSRDLDEDGGYESCNQLKNYITAGGFVLNTHDTMTKYNNKGAVKLTQTLRETFGMDRFHVTGVADADDTKKDSVSAQLSVGCIITDTSKVTASLDLNPIHGNVNGYGQIDLSAATAEYSKFAYTITKTDDYHFTSTVDTAACVNRIPGDYSNLTLQFNVIDQSGNAVSGYKFTVRNGQNAELDSFTSDANGLATYQVPLTLSGEGITQAASTNVSYAGKNLAIEATISDSGLTVNSTTPSDLDAGATDASVSVTLKTADGNAVPAGTTISFNVGTSTYTGTTDENGTAVIAAPSDISSVGNDYLSVSAGSLKYRKYTTKNDSIYFWTERLKAASPADYSTVISNSNVKDYIKYNSPLGLADMWAFYDAASKPTANYRYVEMEKESFDHKNLDLNLTDFERKYGTRKASNVNRGGVTAYPFAISDELLISCTHAQIFALDLEDSSVNVLYTLGANYIDEKVTAEFARYDSGIFAASPRDGMSSYFLYSKHNVFYSGAGHAIITGPYKDNNDERRLFINIIVNSVTKGTSQPALKLYNKCDDSSHSDCDDNFVDPKSDLSSDKSIDTLFYNQAIGMYQYYVDDVQDKIYPEFDFKAVKGSDDISEVQVFYDLNYGQGTDQDMTDIYTNDSNHVLITSYDQSDQIGDKRVKLRESLFPKLELKEDYFSSYGDYTYIVIRVKDTSNIVKSARVKITKIPYLFDLTDADFEHSHLKALVGDITERRQFFI